MTATLGPRVVIAGTHSGVGKTTLATGIAAALTAAGDSVATAKVGPDYIDPGYHALATGRPGRNLDPWLCGEDAILPLAGRAARDSDLLVVEGVMGLFDGVGDQRDPSFASTAHVARLLDAPIVLVVDVAAMSTSVAALVAGFLDFDPRLQVAGVILNRVGSDGHEVLLREAVAALPIDVLGALRRDDALTWRDRHLGLVPVVEHPEAVRSALDRLVARIAEGLDLPALLHIAHAAPARVVPDPPTPTPAGPARVAVADGPAFSFTYPDNLEALAAAGAELLPFDPCAAAHLPDAIDGLVVGGGFPETYAAELADNRPLLADVGRRVRSGLVTWVECGGLLWLSGSLDDDPLVGAVPARGRMTSRLTLGYRTATLRRTCPLGPRGARLRGHEFHYSTVDPPGDALDLVSRSGSARAGYSTETLLASFLHVHLGGDPRPAESFVGLAGRSPHREVADS
ncbi:MAG: cobyrinate a,c-diamide synthase [Acidimicrobiia bacterium]